WRARVNRLEEEKRQVLNETRRAAEKEIEQVRAELNELRKRMQDATPEAELRAEKNRLDELAQIVEPGTGPPLAAPTSASEPLAVGERVWIPSLNQRGEVVALGNHDVDVKLGNVRMKLRLAQVEKVQRTDQPKPVEGRAVRVTTGAAEVAAEIH